MVDKYKVRDYVKEKIGEQYLIPLLGVYDSVNEINFDLLPKQFVIKCNHNSGLGMYICKDKDLMDRKKVIKQLKKGMKEDYYLPNREWPYKDVERKIIVEKYMVDSETSELRDYKLYCFNGEVKLVMINCDRQSDKETTGDYFDKDFNWLDFTWGFKHAKVRPVKPEKYDEMVKIAEKLSKNLKHARIDLYLCNDKIYFGEITFYDGAGFDITLPKEWDYKIGEWLKL